MVQVSIVLRFTTEISSLGIILFQMCIIYPLFWGLRVCLLQLENQANFTQTISNLEEWVKRAVNKYRPQIICLPECFNYTEPMILKDVAETINEKGKTCHTLSKLSEKFGIYIVGGSIIERDGVNLYNTSTVWNQKGELIARYRKASDITSILSHFQWFNIVEYIRFAGAFVWYSFQWDWCCWSG